MDSALIYILGTAALVIYFLLMFRKQIRIILIGLRHGKYSYRYVKQFKKYANKSPFPYCFKDDILPYLRLSMAKKDQAHHYQSEKTLLFEAIPYHTSLREIMKLYGKPDCFNAFKIKDKELCAYGYNKSVYNTSMKVVFFFIFESFVMGEYLVDDLQGVNVRELSKLFLDELGAKAKTESLHYFIDGKNGTSVHFYENGFTAMVRYSNQTNDPVKDLVT
jgi:hypothetical protein